MPFELTKDFLDQLQIKIEALDYTSIAQSFEGLHPADIADILENLSAADAKLCYDLLDEEEAAEALIEMEESFRLELLKYFSPLEIANQVNYLDSDDAADLLGELSESEKDIVIAQVEDKEHAADVAGLLDYDEETAGALMQREYIEAKEKWPVNRCIIELRRQAEEVEKVYTIYVVDDEGKLMGVLSLKRLLFASPTTLIRDLYISDNIRFVKTHDSKEDVAATMEKYDLVSIPVVDRQDILVGRITIDDVVDVIREEAEKDYQMASGISDTIESSSSVWQNTKSRLPWILIGLAGGVTSSQIIRGYEDQIDINPSLAFFIPLVVATAGNVGVQSSAIIVQGLASKDFQFQSLLKLIWKETRVGMIVGLTCALIIFGLNFLLAGDTQLGLTISITLVMVVLIAAILGASIPLLLDKIKIDPALATGPFITTANDMIGLTVYFLVAYFVYLF